MNSSQEKLRVVDRLYRISDAKDNFNVFMELVWKDSKTGKGVKQGTIHRLWYDHIQYCFRNKLYAGILAPWGHGKTENMLGYILRLIGENPAVRIKLVTNSDPNSVARVQTIAQYISDDEDYKAVYPYIKPARKLDWTKHKIIVDRPTKSKDGTVEAYGITSSGMGGRADFLLFDDPVDHRNAIANPALRPKVKEDFWNTWMSRRDDDTGVVYIATVWHQDDLTHELVENPLFCFLHLRVNEDLTAYEARLLPHERPDHPINAFKDSAPVVA